ncbi:MAG: ArsR/SmtB family transcription factor [Alphaproteobacteria bacterium]
MKEGPNIAHIAALVGEPARANMLMALMDGRALTASELAREGGVTPQTASTHLSKLEGGGLVTIERQGRHRYFRLSGSDVALTLENLMGLAARTGHMRVRTGPRDLQMRRARVCYDHLAGELGVALLDTLRTRKFLRGNANTMEVTVAGASRLRDFGIDIEALAANRRLVCRICLDWSERRHHLGGALGAALLRRILQLKWAKRVEQSRVVLFTRSGELNLQAILSLPAAKDPNSIFAHNAR